MNPASASGMCMLQQKPLLTPDPLLLLLLTQKIIPEPITKVAKTHLHTNSFTNGSLTSASTSSYQPSDRMSTRSSLAFAAASLLRHTPTVPSLITSAHCLCLKTGAISNISVRTSLLTAYSRVHDPISSLALFDEADAHDVISWNAIINAFVLNSHFQTSMTLFEEMLEEFGQFDSTTLVTVLSALSRTQKLKHGRVLHAIIIKRRYDLDGQLCNALADMYAKCGDLSSLECVFEEMEAKDSTSWNVMINGCLYNGFPKESTLYFKEMSRSDVRVDRVSLSGVVSACSSLQELSTFGKSVHGWVIKLGYERTSYVSIENSLISFYSRNRDLAAAEKMFRELTKRNVVSWNSMISGLVENNSVHEALDLFWEMQSTREAQPDDVTLVTIIPVYGDIGLICEGKALHGFTIRMGLGASDLSILNSLLGMYISCNDLVSANLLFKAMPNKDLISWNMMISGYSHNDSLKEDAQHLFCELLQTGLTCSLASLLAILPSCTSPEDLQFGATVHCWTLRYGFGNIVSAVNALVLMYINCGDMMASSLLFESILSRSDTVSWNTIIVGYVQNSHHKAALEAFKFMHSSLHPDPDPITFVSLLSACGNLELLFCGKSVHALVIKSSMVSYVRVRNAMLTMYFRCGDIGSAEIVFQTSGDRNLCSWNCMISGFAQNMEGKRAIEFFRNMPSFQQNEISLVGILCACTQFGNLRHGGEVHAYILRHHQHRNIFLSSALVDMYSKCGRLDSAVQVFEDSVEKSVASWNSMISAYGFHGHGRKAIKLFTEMSKLGIKATKSTFIALLSACNHCGLVDEGWIYYNQMKEFGIEPSIEHNVCMVDMLGRAGRLVEAYEFIECMPTKSEPGVLGALLSACKDQADLKISNSIAERLFCLEPENSGYYISLSNLCSYLGMWSDAVDVRSMLQDRGLTKPPGCSLINIRSG